MTEPRDIEHILGEWFEDGPTRIAQRAVDDALLTIDRTNQTRAAWRLPRRLTMTRNMRLATIALAAIAVVAIGAGILITTPERGRHTRHLAVGGTRDIAVGRSVDGSDRSPRCSS